MKKIFSLCLLSIFLFCMIVSPGIGQKTLEVLEKIIEAQGGRNVLGNIKDTTMKGTMDIVMSGMSGALTMTMKEPNMMRMDIEMMGMVLTQAYDGKIAWGTDPQGNVEEMTEEQTADLRRGAYGNDVILNPDKYGVTFALRDTENIEGKDYYVMVLIFPDGYQLPFHIDSKTYLPYKSTMTGNQIGVEVESFFSDYRKVEGTMIPFVHKVFQNGKEFMTMTFTEVKFNSGIKDSFFKMD